MIDHYVKQAQKEGYRARAAYKLLEINDKTNTIAKGMTVVDLGSAPGSWSQVASKLVGDTGTLIASDILPMDALADVTFIQGDFREAEVFDAIMAEVGDSQVDVVLSDMAPNTAGNSAVDRSAAHDVSVRACGRFCASDSTQRRRTDYESVPRRGYPRA